MDGTAEGVAEQQHEQDRLQGGEDQEGGDPDQPPQVPAGDGGDADGGRDSLAWRGGRPGGGGGHWVLRAGCAGCAGSAGGLLAGWPVRARKASSSVGRRSASALTCRPASASRP